MTPAEQYLLELINRARLDPLAEARRYEVDLNQGLQPAQLGSHPRQPLAPSSALNNAAAAHSRWMLETDTFSHTGIAGSTAGERMESAGYVFSGSWTWGENIAMSGHTGPLSLNDEIEVHHEGLFLSPGHRVNILGDAFAEIGIGQEAGLFTDGQRYNASLLTENFARSGSTIFLTGVIYDDLDQDDFYSIGEGVGAVAVGSDGIQAQTAIAGGYALGLTATQWVEAAFTLADGTSIRFSVDMGRVNAKVDLVDGTHIHSSASIVLLSGATEATLLGTDNLHLTGSSANDNLRGNAGANRLVGGAGDDRLMGSGGNDHLDGGTGTDTVEYAGNSTDFVVRQGNQGYTISSTEFGTDTLINVEDLAFLDQVLSVAQAARNTASGGNAGTNDNASSGPDSTKAFLHQHFGLSIDQASEWVMSRLDTPREIYDVCSRNDVTSAMLADIVEASLSEPLDAQVVEGWLASHDLPSLDHEQATKVFLRQEFGLSLTEARDWVIAHLDAPAAIYDVCASNNISSAMLADIVQASFPEVTLTGAAVNEWLNMQGLAALG